MGNSSATFPPIGEATNPLYVQDWKVEVSKRNIPGHSIVQKFGSNRAVTQTLAVISDSGVYMTPTTAQALEFVSDDAADTAAGVGAREITIEGLDSNWEPVIQTLATNGTTPVALTTNLTRLYRWYVSGSGTYASLSAVSYAGTLTIQTAGGGSVWSTIPDGTTLVFPGQSLIGSYTVPNGYKAYLLDQHITVDSNKECSVYFMQRPDADVISAPFSARRIVDETLGLVSDVNKEHPIPKGPFIGPCDLGYIGKKDASGTAALTVEYDLLLIQDGF
jgi:hypothetical protein